MMNGQYELKRRQKTELGKKDMEKDTKTPYGIPIYALIDTINHKRKLEEVRPVPGAANPTAMASSPKKRKTSKVQTELLAEKYRPRQFFDLLGNDDANRQIMRWIHYWKSCVFGQPPILNDYTDRLGRPLRKLLLVNGPPGSGKTSAAHVIAKQAGFDVNEINASDERSAAVVRDRIMTAVESHQVISRRPVLIIADEVEGASENGFVKALSNVLNDDAKALAAGPRNTGSGSTSKKSKSKKNQPKLLLRPIIAICNDVWSPNLHALRQHAEIVHFQRHNPSRLLKRLERICLDEGLKHTTKELTQIADHYDYDLRACLNAIQFGAKQGNAASGEDSSSVELTDWSSLVKQQFLHPRPASFKQLESCSDADKLVAGCFTAYPDSTYIDDLLKKPASIGEYLALADNRRSHDELKALTAFAFGNLFRSPGLSAQMQKIPLNGGRSFGKPPSYYDDTKRVRSIVASAISNCSAQMKKAITEKTALMELFPFLVNISNPVARTMLNAEDKVRLNQVAQGFKALGVSIRTDRTENGTFVHRLYPPIESTCIFGEEARAEAAHGMYVTRSQIKDALRELEKVQHDSRGQGSQASRFTQTTSNPGSANEGQEAKPSVRIAADLTSYFGASKKETSTQIQRKVEHRSKKVWVQYSEGFSNAVRKPIGWDELLGL